MRCQGTGRQNRASLFDSATFEEKDYGCHFFELQADGVLRDTQWDSCYEDKETAVSEHRMSYPGLTFLALFAEDQPLEAPFSHIAAREDCLDASTRYKSNFYNEVVR